MKKIILKLSFLSFFLLSLIALLIVKANTSSASYFTKEISSPCVAFIGTITSFIPFSLFEFIIAILVIALLILLILCLRHLFKKEFRKSLYQFLNILIIISFSLSYFTFTQGIGYNADNLNISLYEDKPSDELIDESIAYFTADYNYVSSLLERDENGFVINPYTKKELNDLINEEFLKHQELNISTYSPSVSTLTFSFLFNEFHITGVSFLGVGQASVSSKLHTAEIPFVTAHEIAHIKGVAKEDQANLTSLYILLNSDIPYLRYSAYYWSYLSLIDIYRLTDYQSYQKIISSLDKAIITETNNIAKYYSEHDLLSAIGNFINNLYLIFNGNKDGTSDYNDTSTSVDTGDKDDQGHVIYEITNYSPYQKLYFQTYKNLL